MRRFTVFLAAVVFVLLAGPAWAGTEPNDEGKADGLKIVVTSLDITDKALNLTYEIQNDSVEDAWILASRYDISINTFGMGGGASLSKDGHSLMYGYHFNKQDRVVAVLKTKPEHIKTWLSVNALKPSAFRR